MLNLYQFYTLLNNEFNLTRRDTLNIIIFYIETYHYIPVEGSYSISNNNVYILQEGHLELTLLDLNNAMLSVIHYYKHSKNNTQFINTDISNVINLVEYTNINQELKCLIIEDYHTSLLLDNIFNFL